jgi:sulfite exporter TauE/SafE
MCGPIALALPINRKSSLTQFLSITSYHLGKTITYVLIGTLSGLAGRVFFMNGLQQLLSITLGSLIVLSALLPRFINPNYYTPPFLNKAYQKLRGHFSDLLGKRGVRAIFGIGLLNGLLPCGMLYMAAAAAAATGNALNAAQFMVGFGIATLPALIAVQSFSLYNKNFRQVITKAFPVMMTAVGILLILRGMNLGIPFISPSIHHTTGVATCQSHLICTH